MVKIDLITGFLGSGKTTFIKKYGSYLMEKGENLGILENDFGAVNVDRMLAHQLMEVFAPAVIAIPGTVFMVGDAVKLIIFRRRNAAVIISILIHLHLGFGLGFLQLSLPQNLNPVVIPHRRIRLKDINSVDHKALPFSFSLFSQEARISASRPAPGARHPLSWWDGFQQNHFSPARRRIYFLPKD